jgi:Protein of unknown function (DUF1275)
MTEATLRGEEQPLPLSMPVLLSFVAGYIDSYTYLGLFGLFVAQVTGSFVIAGAEHRRQALGDRCVSDGGGGDRGAHCAYAQCRASNAALDARLGSIAACAVHGHRGVRPAD